MIQNSSKSYTGFTLIEVMIVVVILGVLAAIALPSYNRYIEDGDVARMKTELLKIVQDRQAARMRNPSVDFSNGVASAVATVARDTGFQSKYDVDCECKDKNTFFLTAKPKTGSGYTKAVGVFSNGDVYVCSKAADLAVSSINSKCDKQ